MICRVHKIICRAHEIINRAHDIIFQKKKLICVSKNIPGLGIPIMKDHRLEQFLSLCFRTNHLFIDQEIVHVHL